MKRFQIKITYEEHLHLVEMAKNGQSVTILFSPNGVYLTNESEAWVIEEIVKLRGF